MSDPRIEQFRGWTKEKFLSNPIIIPERKRMTRLWEPTICRDKPRVTFAGFEAKIAKWTIVVFDGDKIIATYINNPDADVYLVIDSNYRGRGLGTKIMYEMALVNGGLRNKSRRTKELNHVCEKVWNKIQQELSLTNQ